jgi:hypothetical protein
LLNVRLQENQKGDQKKVYEFLERHKSVRMNEWKGSIYHAMSSSDLELYKLFISEGIVRLNDKCSYAQWNLFTQVRHL